MDCLIEKGEVFEEERDEFCEVKRFKDFIEEKGRESCSSSDFLTSETGGVEEQSHSSSEESSSPPSLDWTVKKAEVLDFSSNGGSGDGNEKPHLEKEGSGISEVEMMKERFAKLLLGEDMSGCGNGVSTALAISNAITNLCATLFGQLWRLEPLPLEKKAMWRREMEWLLSVSDHIVELMPSWQTFSDGTKLEVMTCRPRSDLYINLPALRKLDNMLLEILDTFSEMEFWYVDKGISASGGSPSLGRTLQRQEEKWWLPVPRVPPGGLSEETRKQLQHTRDCTNQILKAAMSINSITLAEMEVPDSFLHALPKNARTNLGDIIYRYITSDQFSPECLMGCLDLSSEHQALEIANRVEASLYAWRRKTSTSKSISKSSWGMVKDLMADGDKRELLAERAEILLLCLRQRFPGLPQTTLDMSKIQTNKDVGKSILESYSRVLESVAYNVVARIDDLFYVDDLTKLKRPGNGILPQKTLSVPFSLPVSTTPYKTAFAKPTFSPSKSEIRSPFVLTNKIHQHGFGAKRVLTDHPGLEDEEMANCESKSKAIGEESTLQSEENSFESAETVMSSPSQDSEKEEEEQSKVL